VHLVKAMGERANWSSSIRDTVTRRLTDADAFVQRAAIECIGRHPTDGTERLLVQAALKADPADELLIHTAKIAVRDSLIAQNSFAAIDPTAWEPAERDRLLESCLGAPQTAAADLTLRSLQTAPWPEPLADELTQHAARNLVQDQLVRLAIIKDQYRKSGDAVQLRVLRAAQRGLQERGQPLLADWIEWAEQTAQRLIADEREPRVKSGIELIRDLKLKQTATSLPGGLAADAKHPALRPVVLEALAAVDHPQIVELAGQLLDRTDVPADQQQAAIQVLGNLNRDQSRALLMEKLKSAPAAMALLLARGLALGATSGNQLLDAIEKGQASPRLLQDQTVEQRLRSSRVKDLDARRAKLLESLPPEDDRLKQLQKARWNAFQKGQPAAERGATVFQKNCANCHRVNNQGTKIGPELDGVGLRGLDRLLEDTLDPNRNVDAAFRQTVVALKDGKVQTGLVLREEGAVLILADELGKEQRIPLSDVEERNQVKLSPMPANVAEKLSEADFIDLMAFLVSQRTKMEQPK
jgi:putative heme-binding domain-containing protein